jgi:Flp pilus assembly protein TadD
VYQRRGDLPMAEKVFRAALLREPENIHVMHNLVPVLAKQGKDAESKALAARVATLDPTPAFHYFRLGQAAMAKGNYAEAKRLFNKEVRRSPYYHEFHFWLALAQLGLGEANGAREQLHLARDTSNTVALSRRYSAKLDHLRSLTRRPVVLN